MKIEFEVFCTAFGFGEIWFKIDALLLLSKALLQRYFIYCKESNDIRKADRPCAQKCTANVCVHCTAHVCTALHLSWGLGGQDIGGMLQLPRSSPIVGNELHFCCHFTRITFPNKISSTSFAKIFSFFFLFQFLQFCLRWFDFKTNSFCNYSKPI